jgi:Domain of unknown function (DUF305)/Domain of unknown function DUF302
MAIDGLVSIPSAFGPKETMDRLESEVKAKGLTVFARVDHAAGAQAVGLKLRPTELLIFGNARGGTPLMAADQRIGIDLPLKRWSIKTTTAKFNWPISIRLGLRGVMVSARPWPQMSKPCRKPWLAWRRTQQSRPDFRARVRHRASIEGPVSNGDAVTPSIFRASIISHTAAIALGAVAAAVFLTVHSANSQSLAAYISALCAKPFRSASTAEAPYLAENVSAMTKMMIDMGIKPSGDVDTDFVAMMTPHHQGAIEMAQAELRYGRNESLRRMAQEIIVTQLQEITAMRLALGQPLPSPTPSADQISPAATNNSQSGSAARQ